MNPVHVILVATLNNLVIRYNNKEEGINFVDVRNLQSYIEGQGISLPEVNTYIAKQNIDVWKAMSKTKLK